MLGLKEEQCILKSCRKTRCQVKLNLWNTSKKQKHQLRSTHLPFLSEYSDLHKVSRHNSWVSLRPTMWLKEGQIKQSPSWKATESEFSQIFKQTCRWNALYHTLWLTYNLESANDLTKHWSFLTVKSSLQLGEITLERTKASQYVM